MATFENPVSGPGTESGPQAPTVGKTPPEDPKATNATPDPAPEAPEVPETHVNEAGVEIQAGPTTVNEFGVETKGDQG